MIIILFAQTSSPFSNILQTNLDNEDYQLCDDWIPAFQNLTGQRDHHFYLINDKRQKIILKAVSVTVSRLLYVEALD